MTFVGKLPLGKMRGAEWKSDGEGRATAQGTIDANGPTVKVDELLDKRKPDAAAFDGASPRSVDAVKALKDTGKLICGNAGARVTDTEFDMGIVFHWLDSDGHTS
jgi:hypothetical protein